ncbi:MAG: DUF4347 domain-containing protein, partial [Marinobacterium sp.]|nr:DUF4347 domain-containing protein [Marinobacterium sp.]
MPLPDSSQYKPNSHTIKKLIVIDRSLADADQIAAQRTPDSTVLWLNNTQDGLQQITDTLAHYSGIESLHIFSHGSPATLQLGSSSLTEESITRQYQAQLNQWQQALTPEADILLYGCNVAEGEQGQAFVEALSQVTGADIAASDDLTGHSKYGGNWELEYQTGKIENTLTAVTALQRDYNHQLPISATEITGLDGTKLETNDGSTYASGDGSYLNISGSAALKANANGAIYAETSEAEGYFDIIADQSDVTTFDLDDINITFSDSGDALVHFISIKKLDVTGSPISGTEVLRGNTLKLGSFGISNPLSIFSVLENSPHISKSNLNSFKDIYGVRLRFIGENVNFGDLEIQSLTLNNRKAPNNDPVITLPSAPTVLEDASDIAIADDIQITDDNASDIQAITLTMTGGTANVVTTTGLTELSGNNSALISFKGSLTDVNNALDSLTFTPDYEVSGTDAGSVRIQTDDGNGGNDDKTVTFDITAVNDRPSLSIWLRHPTYTEGGRPVQIFNHADASTWEDDQTFKELKLTITNVSDGNLEKLHLIDTNPGSPSIALVDEETGNINDDGSIYYSVAVTNNVATVRIMLDASRTTVNDFENIINTLMYINNSENPTPGERIITIAEIIDSGGDANGGEDTTPIGSSSTVTVVAVNVLPTASDKTLALPKNSATAITYDDIGFNDVDGDALHHITLTSAPGQGTLWVDTDDDGTVNGAEQALTDNATVMAADIDNNKLKFRPATDALGAAYAQVSFTVNDGTADASSANTWTLDVVSAPELDLNGAASGHQMSDLTYTEQYPSTDPISITADDASIIDDDANLSGMAIKIIDGVQPGDDLSISRSVRGDEYFSGGRMTLGDIEITINDPTTEMTLSGTASKADYIAILKGVQFNTDDSAVGGDARIIEVTATDENGNTGPASTATITVNGVNSSNGISSSVLNDGFTEFTVTEDSTSEGAVTRGSTYMYVVDNDGEYEDELTLSATLSDAAAGTLSSTGISEQAQQALQTLLGSGNYVSSSDYISAIVTPQAEGILGSFNSQTGIWSYTGSPLMAKVALARLVFTPAENYDQDVTLTFQATDGGEDGIQPSAERSLTIHITPVNDAPELDATGATPGFTANGQAINLFSNTDIDTIEAGQNLTQLTLTVTQVSDDEYLVIDGHSLGISNTATGVALGDYSADVNLSSTTATITLDLSSGANGIADIQTLIDGLQYRNDTSTVTEGNRVITLTSLKDDGGTANSGSDTVSGLTIAATVAVSNNNAPTGADKTLSLSEDGRYTLKTSDFGFSDTDASDTLHQVRIDSLPTRGGLLLNGATVKAGTAVLYAQLEAGLLSFVPSADSNGYSSLTFSVHDGHEFSAQPSTLHFSISALNDSPTGTVEIAGSPTQGQTLTASQTLADVDGIGEVAYQWLRDGQVIEGATTDSYTLNQHDVGAQISVQASYTDLPGTRESVVSATTSTVENSNDAPEGTIQIEGTPEQGQTLTLTSTLTDADGIGTLSYQWLRDGIPVDGATADRYTLTQSDVGTQLSVQVNYTDLFGSPESVISAITNQIANINDRPTGAITINGVPTEGQTLSVRHSLADPDGMGDVHYQWLRDGRAIEGATTDNYTLTQVDVGSRISVQASYTDLSGSAESLSVALTQAVNNLNNQPAGHVSLHGTATQGQVLTVHNTLTDADGMGPIHYQWLRDGQVIEGATTNSYTLTQHDVGAQISVQARYTDQQGTQETVTATATGSVTDINDTPQGGLQISGTTEQGQQLTVTHTLTDADGMGPIHYQWLRDGQV